MKFRAQWTWPWGPPFVVSACPPLRRLTSFARFADTLFMARRTQITAVTAIILSAYLDFPLHLLCLLEFES